MAHLSRKKGPRARTNWLARRTPAAAASFGVISIQKNRFPGGRQKAVTFSYDDGSIYDRRLVEIFNRAGLKASFHLNSGRMEGSLKLPPEEIAPLYAGHEISAHSITHPILPNTPTGQFAAELVEDRRTLEALAGYPVRGMSWPYGGYTAEQTRWLEACGIEYSRTVRSHGAFTLPENFREWHPTCHHRDEVEARTAAFLNNPASNRLWLLYIWGHSIDFERAENWDVIERVADTLAPLHETLWFATNIEIVDYIQALNQLRVSVDGSLVQNLSHLRVWFTANGALHDLAPGELRRLG